MLLVNWSLPYILRYVHECAAYIETNFSIMAIAFVALSITANLLYKVFTWLLVRSRVKKPYLHTFIFWSLLVGVAWLMINGFLVSVLPVLLKNPELLCD